MRNDSMSQCPLVQPCKDWLAIPVRSLPVMLKGVFGEVSFLINHVSGLKALNGQYLCLPGTYCGKDVLPKYAYFLWF